MRAIFLAAVLACLTAPPALVQDPAKVDSKHTKIEFENDQVRVLRYSYGPHEKSPMHEHPNNVQIMLTDAHTNITTADGKTTESHGKAGEVRWRIATKHAVENIGDQPFEGILVELKTGPGATKTP